MLRLRIGVEGRLMGFLPIKWTFVARDVAEGDVKKATWACAFLNGISFKTGVVTGTTFATLS
jgi:hypothetical protein